MREYLLVWRGFPKLLVGGLFTLEILALIFSRDGLLVEARRLLAFLKSMFTSGATLLVAIILAVVLMVGLGLFILEILRIVAGVVVASLMRLRFLGRFVKNGSLQFLLLEPYKLVPCLFQLHEEWFAEYCALKSCSFSLESLREQDQINKYTHRIRPHLANADPFNLDAVNFYGMLGQDRKTVEILEDDVRLLGNLCIVSVLFAVLMHLHLASLRGTLAALLFAVLFVIMMLPEIMARKRFISGFLLAAALDFYVVNEGADIADREGETSL